MPARLIITGILPEHFVPMQDTFGPPRVVDNQIRWRNNTIEIDYTYNDFLEKYREFKNAIGFSTGKRLRPEMMEAFATDFYKKEQANLLDNTRDHYRNSIKPPSDDPGVDVNDTQQAGTGKCLNGKQGMCLGGGHSDQNTKAMLCDMLDDDSLTNSGVGLLFIEEFKAWAQPMINDYLNSPANTPMPKALSDYLDGINRGFWRENIPPKNFKTLIEKAKAKGVKVYGIDSGDADPGVNNLSALHPERRDALMNKVAEDVIRQALLDHPGQKFIASVGAAHMNCHEGGIPGIAQIFDIPAVVLDQNDKLVFVPDDPSNHEMPSKEEQHFIDKFIEQIETRQGGPPQQFQDPNQPNNPYDPNYKKAMRRVAKKLAADLKQQGKLNALNDVDVALKSPEVVRAVEERAKFNKLENRTQVVEEHLKNMHGPQALEGLRDDPRLVAALGLDQATLDDALAGLQPPEVVILDYKEKKAIANANAALLQEPNYHAMDNNQRQQRLKELTDKARFDIAKEACLEPYLSIRKEIVDAEEDFTKRNAREGTDLERTRQHQERIAALNEELKQCRSDTERFLNTFVNDHPEILQQRDADNMTLLHFAAIQVNSDMMGIIAGLEPGLMDLKDNRGKAAAHYVLERRDFLDEGLRNDLLEAQSNGLLELIDRGANLDIQNDKGETPMHLAALNGNAVATDNLIWRNAKTDIRDNRNWSAYDVCLTATKPDVEKVFYDRGVVSPKFVPQPPNTSIVDILMQATLIEDPNQVNEVRAMYEKMYADENLRPILEAAAIDAMQDRDPPKEGGLRIGVANANSTGRLYNAPQWYPGGEGGYDEKANTFLLAGNPDPGKIKEGTLIHEMTHMVTRKMFGPDTVPYGSDQDKQAYQQAIMEDVRNMHLMNDSNPVEARVKRVMSDRMETYANRGGDGQMLQEFIVGVPQLIAEFGADAVNRCVPNLMRFYKDFTAKCHTKMTTDPKYQNLHATIDNNALDQKLLNNPPQLPQAPDDWLPQDSRDLTLDAIMDKVKAEYKMRHGHPQLPHGATFPYSANQYVLNPIEEGLFDAKMQTVRAALEKSLVNGSLAREISPESVRVLVVETMDLADKHDMRNLDKIEGAVTGHARNWTRDSKVRYVNHKIDQGQVPTSSELAEATMIMAEDNALVKLGDGDPTASVDVDPKKHEALVKSLTKELEERRLNGQLPPLKIGTLMKQLSTAMVNSDKTPFTIKKKAEPGHVSMDKTSMRKAWVKKLQTI